MKKVFPLVLVSLLLWACNSKNDSTNREDASQLKATTSSVDDSDKKIEHPNVVIKGIIEDAPNMTVVLEANAQNITQILSKTKTNDKGEFVLKGKIKEMGLYQLRLDSSLTSTGLKKIVPVTLVPKDTVEVYLKNGDLFNMTAKYSGTVWANTLNSYMGEINAFQNWRMQLKTKAQKEKLDREKIKELMIERINKMDQKFIAMVKESPANPGNILLMTNLMPVLGLEYYDTEHIDALKVMLKAYQKKHPNSVVTESLEKQIPLLEKKFEGYQLYKVQGIAPDIALPNPQGDTMRLSDLRGHYVLLDFWASWCDPCRRENPNVVKAYKKYHNDGFRIYSVSLDKTKQAWVAAIQQDGLVWDNHVSELNYWNSAVASEYGVRAIPHSFLLNPKGKIIAENLRGPSLEKKLSEVYGH